MEGGEMTMNEYLEDDEVKSTIGALLDKFLELSVEVSGLKKKVEDLQHQVGVMNVVKVDKRKEKKERYPYYKKESTLDESNFMTPEEVKKYAEENKIALEDAYTKLIHEGRVEGF